MLVTKQQKGLLAENYVADYLQKLNHKIVARRFRVSVGELDLITFDPNTQTVNFWEVKSSTVSPEWASSHFDRQQIKNKLRVIAQFLTQFPQWKKYPSLGKLALVVLPFDQSEQKVPVEPVILDWT